MTPTPSGAAVRTDAIRILHVEDDHEFAEMAQAFLVHEDDRFDIETVSSVSEALDRLANETFDCIVSDHDMPGQTGIDLLETVRDTDPDIPFVLFTGKGSEEVASRAIAAGVSDYLQKSTGTEQYSLLANRITNLVAQYQAEANLERRLRQQRITANLGQAALASDELQPLFEQAVEGVCEGLDTEFTKVLEYQPADENLLLRAGVGWRDGLVGEATVGIDDDSQAGHTLRSEEPIVVHDLRTETRFQGPEMLSDHEIVSGISVIIGSMTEPWGVLGTHTTDKRAFTADDVNFVQSVANVLANAIELSVSRVEDRQRRILFEHSPDMIDVLDSNGRLLDANRRFCDELGYDRQELVGKPIWELDQAVDADDVAELLSDFELDERRQFEGRYERRDGSSFPVEVHLLRLELDGENCFLAISRDLTTREEYLEQFRGVLAAVPDAMIITDDEGVIRAANQQTTDVLGYTPAELDGKTIEELLLEEDRASHVDDRRAYMQSPEPRPMGRGLDLYALHKDGTQVPVEISLGPIEHDDDLYVVATISDISSRKQREETLEQQNSSLETFADIVAHDIRGPLSVIDGRLQLARRECDSEHLDAIKESVERIDTLVDEVLGVAREGAVIESVGPVDLSTVVEQCWLTVQATDATLVNEAERTIRADHTRLQQLIQNLVQNAVDHGPPDVTVTVGLLDDGFYVEDDGPGIPTDRHARVFQWGYSSSTNGIGFGLAIVDQIAEAHGWQLELTDSPTGGARFEVHGVEFVDT